MYIISIPCIYYALCCVLHLQYPCLQIVVSCMYTYLVYTFPFSPPSKGTMVRVPSHSGKIRESGKLLLIFPVREKVREFWNKCRHQGKLTKTVWKSGNLICLTALLDVKVLLRSPHSHIGSTALMAVSVCCVCVCVCDLGSEQI